MTEYFAACTPIYSWIWSSPLPQHQMIRNWQNQLTKEMRSLGSSFRQLDVAERTAIVNAKRSFKNKKDEDTKAFGREIVLVRKAKARIHKAKALFDGIRQELQHSVAVVKMSKTIETNAQLYTLMNQISSVPALKETCKQISKEMQKAGMIEEMMENALDPESEDIDEAADNEIQAALSEVLSGKKVASGPIEAKPEEIVDAKLLKELEELQPIEAT